MGECTPRDQKKVRFEFSPREAVAALDSLRVPYNTPVASTRHTEAREFMQLLLESLNGVCECTPREAVAALDSLRVPYNTPAAALYGQDNSPWRSDVTNRFAMVGNEDAVCCA